MRTFSFREGVSLFDTLIYTHTYIYDNTNDCIPVFPAQGSCLLPRFCLLSASFVICPGPLRAPFIAVVPQSPFSGLDFLLVLLLDLCLPCVPFVPLDFASSQLPTHPARWTYHLAP